MNELQSATDLSSAVRRSQLRIPPGQVRPLFYRGATPRHGRSLGMAHKKAVCPPKTRPAAPEVSLKDMDLPQASRRSRLCRDRFFKRAVLPVPAKPLNHQSVPPGCFQGCLRVCAIQRKHTDLLSTGQLECPMLGAEAVRILPSEVISWVFIKHIANRLL